MVARASFVVCALGLTRVQGQLTGSPTPAPPAPQVPSTPAPTWSTDDAQAAYVDWEEHCELNLNYDECFSFATSEGLDFTSPIEANQGLPSGCFRQYPDAVVVFNQQPSFQYIPMADNGLCPRAEVTIPGSDTTPYVECYLKMVCRAPDFDQLDAGEFCGENQGLTQNECAAIGGAHAQSGSYESISISALPKGCLIDVEDHATMFNAHPIGSSDVGSTRRMLCSQDMGPTDAPTPDPTPQPTPVPTITPTWAPMDVSEFSLAPAGEDCQLHLNMEECEFHFSNQFEASAYFTTNDPAEPFGCFASRLGCEYLGPDGYCAIVFNKHPTNNANALAQHCETDAEGHLNCYRRNFCRTPDWYASPSFCQAGTEMTEHQCRRIGDALRNGVGGYRTEKSGDAPNGCYINRDDTVVFNKHSSGSDRARVTALCRKEPHRCAAKRDGLQKNRWCQRKCNKKKKKACNRKCATKCIDTCKCNAKCADDVLWYYLEPTANDWNIKRGCAWAAQDPDTRCKLKGSFQETDSTGVISYEGYGSERLVRAKAACPSACGKCKTRRLSAQVLV